MSTLALRLSAILFISAAAFSPIQSTDEVQDFESGSILFDEESDFEQEEQTPWYKNKSNQKIASAVVVAAVAAYGVAIRMDKVQSPFAKVKTLLPAYIIHTPPVGKTVPSLLGYMGKEVAQSVKDTGTSVKKWCGNVVVAAKAAWAKRSEKPVAEPKK
jgi:hypothetical protein